MAAEGGQRAIQRPDLVLMYDVPKAREACRCTAMGRAGLGKPGSATAAGAAGVLRFCCSVGFLTEFLAARERACKYPRQR